MAELFTAGGAFLGVFLGIYFAGSVSSAVKSASFRTSSSDKTSTVRKVA